MTEYGHAVAQVIDARIGIPGKKSIGVLTNPLWIGLSVLLPVPPSNSFAPSLLDQEDLENVLIQDVPSPRRIRRRAPNIVWCCGRRWPGLRRGGF